MTVDQIVRAEETVARWRTDADADNPAGPLYTSGAYAEADITQEAAAITLVCGTGCSASYTRYCC